MTFQTTDPSDRLLGPLQSLVESVDWDAVAGRPAPILDQDQLTASFTGRRVLVTGAAGSLGWALSRELSGLPLEELVLLDAHEPSLFNLRQALEGCPTVVTSVRYLLADIRRRARVDSFVNSLRPQLIFHLAACKHVPWAECDPVEFIATNVLGTFHLVQSAAQHGTGRIVYSSTDKAIEPLSLYGATKRVAERILRAGTSGGTGTAICRFVNVLGSRGAASETFVRLISECQPLPITDPRMRRFWISPRHAVVLLLHAALLKGPLETVVPDVVDDLTPVEIATRLWNQLRPDEDGPDLVISGSRSGERLAEPLLQNWEQLTASELAGLRTVCTVGQQDLPESVTLDDWVHRCARLSAQLDQLPVDELRAWVFNWIGDDSPRMPEAGARLS